MYTIETKSLTKYYAKGKVLGIKDLNLQIQEGEIFGFIGPNGAGKSTTIRLLLDLIRPTSGTVTIFGQDANKHAARIHADLGYLPGEIFLPENITGQMCLDYYKGFKKPQGLIGNQNPRGLHVDEKYLKRLLERFDLDLKKKVGAYSKGNKQKLAIILALMHKPKLLLLDEPTSGLDPLNQQEFYEAIIETKKWGATTFFSTHILVEADKLCDRVGIVRGGKLLQIQDIDEFKEKNIRDIHLETTESIPFAELQSITGIKKVERTTYGYHLTTTGKNGSIIKALSKFKIDDIKVSEPSLEEIFMHFYHKI